MVGDQDTVASPSTMERRVATLRKMGTAVEYHKYRNLGHGFGPATDTSAEGWIADAIRFWERQMTSDLHDETAASNKFGVVGSPDLSSPADKMKWIRCEASRQRVLVQRASVARGSIIAPYIGSWGRSLDLP
jgi:hypothetical protein